MGAHPVMDLSLPIAGVDGHKSLVPPLPIPHIVAWWVGGLSVFGIKSIAGVLKLSDNICDTVIINSARACTREHDAALVVAHIAPNPLLPLVILGSSNKAEFGSGTVFCKNRSGMGKMAVGVAYAVNFQLDCWDFPAPPLPTSVALTALNWNVRAGFGWRDFVAGLGAMIFDSLVQWAINGVVGGRAGGKNGWGKAAGEAWKTMRKEGVLKSIASGFKFSGWKKSWDALKGLKDPSKYLKDNGGKLWEGAKNQYESTFKVGGPTGLSPGDTKFDKVTDEKKGVGNPNAKINDGISGTK